MKSALSEEYDILRIIGEGAFATIFKVRHKKLGYVRAVKVLNKYILSEDDKAYQTFLKECSVLLKLGNGCNPNIVHIYRPDLLKDGKASVEMDYVEGVTLNEYLQRKRFMDITEVLRFVHEISRALAYCHEDIYKFLMDPVRDNLRRDPADASRFIIDEAKRRQLIRTYGVTHNDLHSNNVMRRDYDGSFVLLDFGLAIQNGVAVKSSARTDGALEYRAPEKWDRNDAITTQSDVYSMGILFYEALTGRVPFVYDPRKYANELQMQNELRDAHCTATPPAIEPLRRAAFEATHRGQKWVKDYPAWLESMILKCLAKKPEHRYATAKQFYDELQQHLRRMESPAPATTTTAQPDTALKAENERLRRENERLRTQQPRPATSQPDATFKAELEKVKRQNDMLKSDMQEVRNDNATLRSENARLKSERSRTVTVPKKVYVKSQPWPWIAATAALLLATCALAWVTWDIPAAVKGIFGSSTTTEVRQRELSGTLGDSNTPAATIGNIRLERDVKGDNGIGLAIHVDGTLYNLKDMDVSVVAYFYDSEGNALVDVNGYYHTAGGKVSDGYYFTSLHDISAFSNATLLVPYGELHQKGLEERTIKYDIIIWDQSVSPVAKLACSEMQEFTFTPGQPPTASITKVTVDGDKVHLKLNAYGLKDKLVKCTLFFFHDDATKSKVLTADGSQVTVYGTSTATYESTYWSDWNFALPIDMLDGGKADKYKFDVLIQDEENNTLARTNGYDFEITK